MIIAFAADQYGRYGYRWIAAMLRDAGVVVNIPRVRMDLAAGGAEGSGEAAEERPWLRLNDGYRDCLRPLYPNHIWSYYFVEDRTHNGRKDRMLNVIDEFTRECLAIRVILKLRSTDVIDVLSDPVHPAPSDIVLDTAWSSSPWPSASGSPPSEPTPRTSSEAVHGDNWPPESFNEARDESLNGESFTLCNRRR